MELPPFIPPPTNTNITHPMFEQRCEEGISWDYERWFKRGVNLYSNSRLQSQTPTYMKFLIESTDKAPKQMKSTLPTDDRNVSNEKCYFNILNPSNKIQCDQCKRDITKATKIMAEEGDYCCSCFANLEQYPLEYRVINKLDFPLYDHEWTAEEELLLFEGLEKHGFGNWGDIADLIGTNKTREDVEDHYQNVFLQGKDFLPTGNLLSRRDSSGVLIQHSRETTHRKAPKVTTRLPSGKTVQHNRASLTVNHTAKTGSNPAEILGYMPKRGDFEVQYDNDAQLLLAEMEFNDDDTEEEKAMKLRLIDIYNNKLNDRIKRKEFVISRKLLDLKEQMRLDKARTKDEKEIYNMMKVFARFHSYEEHERLVQGIIKEKQIRQRIEELKELKKKGFRTLAEVEEELESKRLKEERIRKKDQELAGPDKSKTRRMRKDPTIEKSEKRVLYVTRDEEELCKKLAIQPRQYMLIKETLLRESVRLGIVEREESLRIFKIDRPICEAIFDFLVQQEEIIPRNSELTTLAH